MRRLVHPRNAVKAFRQMLLVCVPLVLALSGCNRPQAPAPAAAPTPDPVERGRMLVIGGGCHDCHTPKKLGPAGPEADMDRMLMGHPQEQGAVPPFKQDPKSPYAIHINGDLTAWSGPWGVSYAANLTPDQNTGLGIWTEEMFVNALTMGKHMGTARPILPPMPWNWYGQLPDDDLKAIFAYLKSIKPIANRVPVPLDPSGKPIEAPQ